MRCRRRYDIAVIAFTRTLVYSFIYLWLVLATKLSE